jgi:hypothetical protein
MPGIHGALAIDTEESTRITLGTVRRGVQRHGQRQALRAQHRRGLRQRHETLFGAKAQAPLLRDAEAQAQKPERGIEHSPQNHRHERSEQQR